MKLGTYRARQRLREQLMEELASGGCSVARTQAIRAAQKMLDSYERALYRESEDRDMVTRARELKRIGDLKDEMMNEKDYDSDDDAGDDS
jgi:hypothetical protein